MPTVCKFHRVRLLLSGFAGGDVFGVGAYYRRGAKTEVVLHWKGVATGAKIRNRDRRNLFIQRCSKQETATCEVTLDVGATNDIFHLTAKKGVSCHGARAVFATDANNVATGRSHQQTAVLPKGTYLKKRVAPLPTGRLE